MLDCLQIGIELVKMKLTLLCLFWLFLKNPACSFLIYSILYRVLNIFD